MATNGNSRLCSAVGAREAPEDIVEGAVLREDKDDVLDVSRGGARMPLRGPDGHERGVVEDVCSPVARTREGQACQRGNNAGHGYKVEPAPTAAAETRTRPAQGNESSDH